MGHTGDNLITYAHKLLLGYFVSCLVSLTRFKIFKNRNLFFLSPILLDILLATLQTFNQFLAVVSESSGKKKLQNNTRNMRKTEAEAERRWRRGVIQNW